jgi:aminopeptidase N
MSRSRRLPVALIATICLALGWTAAPVASQGASGAAGCTSGAIGVGDAYYPTMGNGGYDVAHYDLDLTLDVEGGAIDEATVTIDALALVDLCAFNLDFEGLTIDGISVNGEPAAYQRRGKELTVTPGASLPAGSTFTVEARYHGTPIAAAFIPGPMVTEATPDAGVGGEDPDEFSALQGSWFVGDDEIFIFGEPSGHRFWYPVNEHPADKATYTASYTVPEPFDVVANGSLVDQVDNGDTTTFTWESRDPMASYLVMFHAGRLDTEEMTTASGIPVLLSFEESVPEAQREVFRRLPEMVDYAETIFGPYPFESIGAAVVGEEFTGLALETQTIPVYGSFGGGKDAALPDWAIEETELTIFHELAHQWFGNAVSLQQWSDIWLNEGFAGYSEVLWTEHARGEAARDEMLHDLVWAAGSPATIGDPGPADIFSGEVYSRGALTLHAMRQEVGDETFFAILQEWAGRYHNGNASTVDFIALSEEMSGRDLRPLFDLWLFQPDLPPLRVGGGEATPVASGPPWSH